MAHTGRVISWLGAFGFATMEDETAVYIHTDVIRGGHLRVGRMVSFDIEKVDGREDRVKGVNVAGEAVLEKGARLTDEEFAADKQLREDMREGSKAKNKAEYAPVKKEVDELCHSNKIFLLRELLTELDIGVLENTRDGGRRSDPTERGGHKKYTKKEFIAFYGLRRGEMMWQMAAKPPGGRRPAKDKADKH